MGKLTTYVILMMGITALFYFTGLTRDCENPDGSACLTDDDCLCTDRTPSSVILDLVIKPQSISQSSLYAKISLALTGITAAALLAVSFLYRDVKLAILGPIAAFFLLFVSDFVTVIAKSWSVHPLASAIVTLIMSPLLVYYVISVIEWWGGTD